MRSKPLASALAGLALVLGMGGCHTMRFNVSSGEHATIVEERKSFYLWGLVPTQQVDVSTRCPAGVSAIREETTFSDGLFGLLTIGIWQPRSSWYHCLPAEGVAAK